MSKLIELRHDERMIRDAWIELDNNPKIEEDKKEKIIVMRQITVDYEHAKNDLKVKTIRLTENEFNKFVDFIFKELKNA